MHGYERDTRFIPAHGQPATLIELALSRGLDEHRLLRGTGLFYNDILTGAATIRPEQFLQLIDNAQRLMDADDTSFLFGQRLLPGHLGAASDALRNAATLQDALQLFIELQPLLAPLARLRFERCQHFAYLRWQDSCGAGAQWPFLVEALTCALVAFADQLLDQRLPWRFDFRHAQPRHVEQYWVHLSEHCRFEQPTEQLCLPLEYLVLPAPGVSALTGQAAREQARRQTVALGFDRSLLDRIDDLITQTAPQIPSLDGVAQQLDMSPATVKRKLHKHGTGFQQLLDQARRDLALHLYQVRGWDHDAVATHLNLSDPANFRRALKRWTGWTPAVLRRVLQG